MRDTDFIWIDITDDVRVKIPKVPNRYSLIRDWKGIKDKDGNEIPFSLKKAKELFKKYPDFANVVEFELEWYYKVDR